MPQDITREVKAVTAQEIYPLAESERRVRELSLRLINAQERERRRVGQELHDRIGGSLTLLKLAAHRARKAQADKIEEALAEVEKTADEIYEGVRTLSYSLKPDILDDLGLAEALAAYFEEFTDRCGITVGFQHTGLEERLPAEIEITVFRIVQEALVNVARHAMASNVTVLLAGEGHVLSLQIQDDGCGFDPAEVEIQSSGVSGMEYRAQLAGGVLTVDSSPGAGTCVSCELPLSPD